MVPSIQGPRSCRIPDAGLETSHRYSEMDFLGVDNLYTGLVRGSQFQFIIKMFPLDDKPESARGFYTDVGVLFHTHTQGTGLLLKTLFVSHKYYVSLDSGSMANFTPQICA